MSEYRCELCCMSYELKDKIMINKYHCECGRNVCNICIENSNAEKIKCNICANIPYSIRDPDFDCVCEICGDYNGDCFGLQHNKDGILIYMCSCCKNGCYDKNEEDECRCNDILYDNDNDNDETKNSDSE